MEVNLNIEKQEEIMAYVRSLIQKYGNKELGFGRTLPITLKPAMSRFGLDVESAAAHSSRDKVIHGSLTTE